MIIVRKRINSRLVLVFTRISNLFIAFVQLYMGIHMIPELTPEERRCSARDCEN